MSKVRATGVVLLAGVLAWLATRPPPTAERDAAPSPQPPPPPTARAPRSAAPPTQRVAAGPAARPAVLPAPARPAAMISDETLDFFLSLKGYDSIDELPQEPIPFDLSRDPPYMFTPEGFTELALDGFEAIGIPRAQLRVDCSEAPCALFGVYNREVTACEEPGMPAHMCRRWSQTFDGGMTSTNFDVDCGGVAHVAFFVAPFAAFEAVAPEGYDVQTYSHRQTWRTVTFDYGPLCP